LDDLTHHVDQQSAQGGQQHQAPDQAAFALLPLLLGGRLRGFTASQAGVGQMGRRLTGHDVPTGHVRACDVRAGRLPV
jgi:hypothetical protein